MYSLLCERRLGSPAHLILLKVTAALPLLAAALAASPVMAQTTPRESAPTELEEVIVTATRRAEPLSKVAISVSSIGVEEMDQRGVKEFDDLVRLTPGLNLSRQSFTGANQIAIRGISSDAGSGTTGVYIDDTPIQVRNLGFGSGTAFPGLFDVERVEVLRGPQGTLFGAGSEGGTVRFIQTEPSLSKTSTSTRAEVSTLRNGSPSYEAGVAFGAPIIDDRLGFRVSAYFRHEGGYIDEVGGTYKILDPSGESYGNSVAFTRTNTFEKDVNWNSTTAFRAALKFAPSDALTITPSVFFQKHHTNDGAGAGAEFDLATSNLGARDYSRQYYYQGTPGTVFTAPNDPTTTTTLNPMNVPNNGFGDDKFTLSAVAISWDFGPVTLVSNTSYFDRTTVQWSDYTKGYAQFYSPQFFLEADGVTSTGTYVPDGWKGMARYDNSQGNFVQEFRLQSNDASARLTWLAGAFFSHDRQIAGEPISTNFLSNASWVGFYPTAFGIGYYGVNGGDPFGPGSTGAQNFFGDNMLANAVSFLGQWKMVEEQLAGFAQADFKITDKFKATAGVRVSRNKLDFTAAYLGPENNANAPFGFPCAAPPCVIGQGASAAVYPTSSTHSSENAVTPKFGLSYQFSDANLLYATASKGFRPAGASLRVPSICDGDLITNGYVDANGNPVQPESYKSDSVWSYEIGSKNRLFGNRLVIDGSIYEVKWKNIQANVSLPNCSYNFVDNLADATSRGVDLAFQLKASEHLEVDGAFGYNDPKFDKDALSPGGAKIFSKGAGIPDAGAPLTVSLSGEYVLPLASGRQGYFRTDFTHTSEWRRVGNQDPNSPLYDPRLLPIPAFNVVNMRLGARFNQFDVSVFVQNVTDSAPALDLSAGTYYDPQDWSSATLRPRTYGATFTWRN
ncbi:MAG: TonB-dependent receptor [Gammaproteobacteria bacterium]